MFKNNKTNGSIAMAKVTKKYNNYAHLLFSHPVRWMPMSWDLTSRWTDTATQAVQWSFPLSGESALLSHENLILTNTKNQSK